MTSAELRRKATFRSSTETCRFMWIRVMGSLCFLHVGKYGPPWPGDITTQCHPWTPRYTMMEKLRLMGRDPTVVKLQG
jgi:hypothetical protein